MMDFEMRHEARDDGQSAIENRETLAVIHEMPGNGLSGDRRANETQRVLVAAHEIRCEAGTEARIGADPIFMSPPSDLSRSDAGPSDIMRPQPNNAARSANPSAQAGSSSHESSENHLPVAASPTIGSEGHHLIENQEGVAAASETIAVIQQLWRHRQRWHQAEKSLTQQCSAICRGMAGDRMAGARMLKRIEDGEPDDGDLEAMIATAPLLSARSAIRAERLATEKVLEKLARALPVRAWTKNVYGIGDLSLAAIVGEAGDVGSYKSVAALWKRMGLAVINGERQRKKAGDEAFDHGYSPRRRAVMWNIGGALIGGMGKGPRLYVGETLENRPDLSPYQRLFYERLKYEVARNPEMQREPTICPKTGKLRESFSAHAVNRAKRYVEKRFLRNLFAEWRAATYSLKSRV